MRRGILRTRGFGFYPTSVAVVFEAPSLAIDKVLPKSRSFRPRAHRPAMRCDACEALVVDPPAPQG